MKFPTPPRKALTYATATVFAAVLLVHQRPLYATESPVEIPVAIQDIHTTSGPLQTAVLAGGCFWGVQGVFEHVKGVKQVLAGYAGGDRATADYETVSSGSSGHAESVRITYDPAVVSYGQLLQVAFSVVHDPTQLNHQGPDMGTQYRSAIFYADENQRAIAAAYIAQLDKAHVYPRPIVTRLEPLKGFYPAEAYHQDFLFRHPSHPYIAYNDIPKVENFKRVFPGLYVDQPVLAAAR